MLTPREWEVLALVREGMTNPQIARRLGITEHGAKFHLAMILKRLHLRSRREAAQWRPAAGLVTSAPQERCACR